MSIRDLPPFASLRDFLGHLDRAGDLARVAEPVSLVHQMTAVHRHVLHQGGPALRFDAATDGDGRAAAMPVIANLFGTPARVAAGLGIALDRVGELGELLAALREPAPIDGMRDALSRWPMVRSALATRPRLVRRAPVQETVLEGRDADLGRLPVQTCWPGEPAPLITWPLVITRPPGTEAGDTAQTNMGVYRMQVLGRDRAILRWLAHRAVLRTTGPGRRGARRCRWRWRSAPTRRPCWLPPCRCPRASRSCASPASCAVSARRWPRPARCR